MNVLCIDVGGTKVKFLAIGQTEGRKISSGPDFTAKRMVCEVTKVISATRQKRTTSASDLCQRSVRNPLKNQGKSPKECEPCKAQEFPV